MGAEGISKTPLRVVVTGGIGSGKSTVVRMLADRGAVVIETDLIGHQVLEAGGAAFAEVAARWPMVVRDGRIERSLLGAIVFTDSAELAALESITHPHIFGEVQRRVAAAGRQDVVVELPVMADMEGEWVRVVVDAADQLRLSRGVERGMDRRDVADRMASQSGREEWRATGDFVIRNAGSLDDLERAVDDLWATLHGDSKGDETPTV